MPTVTQPAKTHTPFGVAFGTHLQRRRDNPGARFNRERYEGLLARAFARHLSRGGTLDEVAADGGTFASFKLGDNCFAPRRRDDPSHVGAHVARRFVGFGFPLRMA